MGPLSNNSDEDDEDCCEDETNLFITPAPIFGCGLATRPVVDSLPSFCEAPLMYEYVPQGLPPFEDMDNSNTVGADKIESRHYRILLITNLASCSATSKSASSSFRVLEMRS